MEPPTCPFRTNPNIPRVAMDIIHHLEINSTHHILKLSPAPQQVQRLVPSEPATSTRTNCPPTNAMLRDSPPVSLLQTDPSKTTISYPINPTSKPTWAKTDTGLAATPPTLPPLQTPLRTIPTSYQEEEVPPRPPPRPCSRATEASTLRYLYTSAWEKGEYPTGRVI